MDELEAIERLALKARQETPPVAGVGARVMARIGAPRRLGIVPLSLFAVVSAAAAAVVLAVGIYFYFKASDPMTQLFAPLEVGSLW